MSAAGHSVSEYTSPETKTGKLYPACAAAIPPSNDSTSQGALNRTWPDFTTVGDEKSFPIAEEYVLSVLFQLC